jgi:PAS domain S-box-containing protein
MNKSFLDPRMEALNKAAILAITDSHGKIIFVNNMFCEISGYSAEELLGKNHRILKSHVHTPEFFEEMWHTITGRQIWKGRICNKRKTGDLYWVNSTIVPILDEKNNIKEFLSIRFEITKEVALEEQAKQEQFKNIQNAQRLSLARIAGGIGHEIYNPLSIVQALLIKNQKLLESEVLDRQKFDSNSQKIENQVRRIVKIVQGMRAVTDDGENELATNCDITEIIDSALELCRENLKLKNIELRLDIQKSKVLCRKAQIIQVFLSLISNSSEALIKIDAPRWIEIKITEILSTALILTVTDSGNGIPEEIANRIMDPFFTTKPAGNGIGLGLTVAQNILTANKGILFLDKSSPNTRFVIELPR